MFRAAGIRQAASWVKESWRKGGELYWSSWMHLDDRTSAALVLFLYTCTNMHSFPSSSDCTGHTTLGGLYEITPFSAIGRNVLHWAYTLNLVANLISGKPISCQAVFLLLLLAFSIFFFRCSCTCFPLRNFFIFNSKYIFVMMTEIDFKTAFHHFWTHL